MNEASSLQNPFQLFIEIGKMEIALQMKDIRRAKAILKNIEKAAKEVNIHEF